MPIVSVFQQVQTNSPFLFQTPDDMLTDAKVETVGAAYVRDEIALTPGSHVKVHSHQVGIRWSVMVQTSIMIQVELRGRFLFQS